MNSEAFCCAKKNSVICLNFNRYNKCSDTNWHSKKILRFCAHFFRIGSERTKHKSNHRKYTEASSNLQTAKAKLMHCARRHLRQLKMNDKRYKQYKWTLFTIAHNLNWFLNLLRKYFLRRRRRISWVNERKKKQFAISSRDLFVHFMQSTQCSVITQFYIQRRKEKNRIPFVTQ